MSTDALVGVIGTRTGIVLTGVLYVTATATFLLESPLNSAIHFFCFLHSKISLYIEYEMTAFSDD